MRRTPREEQFHASVDPHSLPNEPDEALIDAAIDALRAGAVPPLTYQGRGGEGTVFCDQRGHAFKVSRWNKPGSLREEAEFLAIASQLPALRRNVAKFYRYHAALDIIERECVAGESRWRYTEKGNRRRDLWEFIAKVMHQYGRGAPEFKEDSFIFARGRGWVLVDAGFAIDNGRALVRRALDFFRRAPSLNDASKGFAARDLIFAIGHESGKTIPPHIAKRLLQRLEPYEKLG